VGRIRRLDETLSNQIAAGEVVERPASAAKELVENALDAGATSIVVEVVGGGVRRLRVADDGHGMDREDALLALERHATSKLRTADDLSHIHTLGFRGEALPSIASVSRFTLRTREPTALAATRIRVEGGRVLDVSEAGAPPGTEILVEDLFFNVPARRKFLKKDETEATHVVDLVVQLALAWPGVAFRVIRDERVTVDVAPHARLVDRVRALFGRETRGELHPVDFAGAFSLSGLVAGPETSFGSARHYHLFLNGRAVRDRVLVGAVQQAYAGQLERGRHPFVVLHLRVPPETVDVNVHPAKTEVRFLESGAVHRFVFRAVSEALQSRAGPEGVHAPDSPAVESPARVAPSREYVVRADASVSSEAPPVSGLDAQRQRIFDALERLGRRRAPFDAVAAPAAGPEGARSERASRALIATAPEPTPGSEPTRGSAPTPNVVLPGIDEGSPAGTPSSSAALPASGVVPLGLVSDRLALARSDGTVWLVDVPAAVRHLAEARMSSPHAAVRLSRPVPVELDPGRAQRLGRWIDVLRTLGLEVEPFGGATWLVSQVPAGLEGLQVSELLRHVLEVEPRDARGVLERLGALVEAVSPVVSAVALGPLLRALQTTPGVTFTRVATAMSTSELERRLPQRTRP
jgi:DNA mismatch repair protein MutL